MSSIILLFFKKKTADDLCIRAWCSDVCSSDLRYEPAYSGYPDWLGDEFDRHEIVDAVARSFAAETRFLDPAEWRDFAGNHACIDAHHPQFERFGDPHLPIGVACVVIGGTPRRAIVHAAHRQHGRAP